MTESKIEPALTPDAWASVQRGQEIPYAYGHSVLDELGLLQGDDIPAAIAFLNHQLADDDPRKITREVVTTLDALVEEHRGDFGPPRIDDAVTDSVATDYGAMRRLIALLESYLPPNEPEWPSDAELAASEQADNEQLKWELENPDELLIEQPEAIRYAGRGLDVILSDLAADADKCDKALADSQPNT